MTPQSDPAFEDLPIRRQILWVAERLARSSRDGTFSAADIVSETRRLESPYRDSTIQTYVTSVMCANSPDNQMHTFHDLVRVDEVRYVLAATPARS